MHVDLAAVWFVLLGVLLAGYAILDGFDLGAGALHLLVARTDAERRTVMTAIGPVWDGNEVWLVTAGGALFAAFPSVYATAASGFYLAIVLVLAALILRAVSLEFRGKEERRAWRLGWDIVFSVSSALVALLLGVALGNVVRGLPLDADGSYRGGLVGLLNPFALAAGVLALAVAVQQGAAWLVLKTDDAVRERARVAQAVAGGAVVVAFAAVTAIGLADARRIFDNFATPLAWAGPVLFGHAVAFTLWSLRRRREVVAFLFSSLTILGLAVTAGVALYPNLLPATETARSLTVSNAASSDLTLSVMLAVAAIGMPLVLLYTAFIYSRFRGKVRPDEVGSEATAEAAPEVAPPAPAESAG